MQVQALFSGPIWQFGILALHLLNLLNIELFSMYLHLYIVDTILDWSFIS